MPSLALTVLRNCNAQYADKRLLAGSLRPGAHQGNWQLKRNRDFREVLSA
jgi:hypothetical protein